MHYQKPFKTYSEQVDLLISRGLIINDRSFAEHTLSLINYYRFSAYALPFQKVKDVYDKGTTFEQIINLYQFDKQLRALLFDYIECLEIALRAKVSYYLAEKYGAFGYTELKNFSPQFNHSDWLNGILEEISRSKETFIEHYKNKYHKSKYLPVWMAVEIFSFGSLSILLHGMTMFDQKALGKSVNIPAPVLTSWFHCLTYIRNICAHHSRLWNRELAIRPKFPHNDKNWDLISNQKIFSILTIIQYLNKKMNITESFYNKLTKLLTNFKDISISSMGFIDDWENIPIWKEK